MSHHPRIRSMFRASSAQARPTPGFALIISMVLMAFLLVLIVSLSSFTRVESLSATASFRNLEARQNAVFGLYEAMGELQKYAGPDQRVTATAEILNNAALQDGGALEQYSKWTGVWDSSDYSQRDGDVKPDPRWLVSLNGNEALKASLDPANVPAGQEWIQLVSDARGTPVEAALVNTDDGKGAYAWWVGDEGVKADIHPRRDVAYDTEDNAEFLAPVGSGYALATNDAGDRVFTAGDPDIDGRDLWARDELAIVAGANMDDARALYHDVTTYSRGLLTDTKNGGLRYDLTTALAAPTAAPQGPMITDAAGNDLLNGFGPDWAVLRSFWQLRADAADGSVDIRGHRSHDWSTFSVASDTSYNSQLTPEQIATPQHGAFPVVTDFQMYIYTTLVPQTGGGYRCRVYYVPSVTVWNPYSVALEGNMLFVMSGSAPAEWRVVADFLEFPSAPDIDSIKTDTQVGLYRVKNGDGTQQPFYWGRTFGLYDKFKDDDTRLELALPTGGIGPGESLTFRLEDNIPRPNGDNAVTLSSSVMDNGAGFYHTSTNTLFPETSTNNFFYLNTRIQYPGTPTKTNNYIKPFDKSFYWLTFRLYGLDTYNEISDLLEYHNLTVIKPIPGFGSWGWYTLGMREVNLGFVFNDSGDRVDPADPNLEPAFGIEWSLPYPEVAAYERVNNAGGHPRPRLYGALNFRSSNQSNESSNNVSVPKNSNFSSYIHFSDVEKEQLFPADFGGVTGPRNWSLDGGVARTVLFDIPSTNVPFHSIAQLSQANLVDSAYSPNFQVGNSRPHMFLAPNALMNTEYSEGTIGTVADWSYLLNDVLWDRYFFSTYDNTDATNPVWHPQYIMDETVADDPTLLSDSETAAAHLTVDGMFNVNSTSVGAWKVLLGAFYEENQRVQTEAGNETYNDGVSPFLRFQHPLSHSFTNTSGAPVSLSNDAEEFSGYRTLDDDEIDTLARNIVEEVKTRGPFLSMAEFVNRQYNPASTLDVADGADMEDLAREPELMGALQSAIELSGLNERLTSGANYVSPGETSDVYSTDESNYPANKGAAAGSYFEDAPGYFSQIDILSRLGSVMSARSDVFVIRTYGRTINPLTEETQGEAWLEAVVERTVTPVEPSGDNAYEPADPDVLGRQFKIVGFRWLSPEEV